MWLDDPYFVKPYRQGHARGPDKLWTERLLAHALESLVYGYLLTADAELLSGARELFETAWRHITAPTAAHVKAITGHAFPPQPCLVHSSGQHEGWPPAEPFCSPWMSALLVDPLLRYQAITGDSRVDEVLLRLGRYLRDTATTYFYGNPLGDTFFTPKRCYKHAPLGQPVRTLVPAYGAARRADGSRYLSSEWDDFDHCADATALSAAALRAARRLNEFDRPGPAPFRTEGDSLLAMHHELAHCALTTFEYFSRTNRDPRRWTSAELAKGFGDPEWIVANKIGFPSHATAPLRKLSWWFNGSLLQFRLLRPGRSEDRHLAAGCNPACGVSLTWRASASHISSSQWTSAGSSGWRSTSFGVSILNGLMPEYCVSAKRVLSLRSLRLWESESRHWTPVACLMACRASCVGCGS